MYYGTPCDAAACKAAGKVGGKFDVAVDGAILKLSLVGHHRWAGHAGGEVCRIAAFFVKDSALVPPGSVSL